MSTILGRTVLIFALSITEKALWRTWQYPGITKRITIPHSQKSAHTVDGKVSVRTFTLCISWLLHAYWNLNNTEGNKFMELCNWYMLEIRFALVYFHWDRTPAVLINSISAAGFWQRYILHIFDGERCRVEIAYQWKYSRAFGVCMGLQENSSFPRPLSWCPDTCAQKQGEEHFN